MLQVDTHVTTVHYGVIDADGRGSATDVVAVDRGWRDRAVCRGVDPELFFPVGDDGPGVVQVAAAKAVCGRCPVRGPCLAFALVALSDGVAGGLTAAQRRQLRAQRRRVVA